MLPARLQFLIVIVASSINERMQKRIDYKAEEVLVLKGILRSVTGKARIDFNESQRKRLGVEIMAVPWAIVALVMINLRASRGACGSSRG